MLVQPTQLQQGVVTQDKQLLLITAHRYYMRGEQLKRKLKHVEKVVASWLQHHDRYIHMRQYYSEHYNRDGLVHNLEH